MNYLQKEMGQDKRMNRGRYFWIGLAVVFVDTVILFLCNYDDYHFLWLLSFVRISLILAFASIGLSVAPSKLAATLLGDRDTLKSLPWKTYLSLFLWVGSFFLMSLGYQTGLQAHFRPCRHIFIETTH